MRKLSRTPLVWLTLLALLLVTGPVPILASGPDARLEGILLESGGRAVSGYQVHLIDAAGSSVARSTTDAAGTYAFRGLAEGSYSLGIESPDGMVAPVAAPPLRVERDQLARRDIKLLRGSDDSRQEVLQGNHGLRIWWAGLSRGAKVWTVVGVVVILGVTASALNDDDDASAFTPGL